MSYSYSVPNYQPVEFPQDYNQTKKKSSLPIAGAGLVVGGGVGAYLGSKKNPFVEKGGEITDTFAKNVLEKADDAIKKPYDQVKEVLGKLNSIKTPEDLKSLFSSNPEAKCSVDLGTITADNLSNNKTTIKNELEAKSKSLVQDMKNKIKTFWDKKEKKFIKPDGSDENVFKAIQNASKGAKAKIIAKYAAIGAVATGAIAFIAHKILTSKKDVPPQQF